MPHARLLVVGHTYLERTAQKKLDALARRGFDVALLLPSRWALPRNGLFAGPDLKAAAFFPSLRLFVSPVLRSGHIASFLLAPGAIRRALAEFKPEIVQVEQETYSFAAAQVVRAAAREGCRAVVFGWENFDRPLPLAQRWAERIVLSRSSAVISGNRAGADRVRRKGFGGHICVLPQVGVDPALFRPDMRNRAAPGSAFRVGYIGRLVAEKGVDTILRAAALAVHGGVRIRLLVTGGGPQRAALERLSAELGVAPLIEWSGTVPHEGVPDRMAHLDALVLPSKDAPRWQEQFGLVLAQAMTMSIPVLGSRSGAIPDVIGREDLTFPQEDHEALASLLVRLARDEGFRREAGDWGLERARKHFTVDAVADGLCRFYERLRGAPDRTEHTDYGYADDARHAAAGERLP